MTASSFEVARYHNESALEFAAENGSYQARIKGGRPVTFFEVAGVLEAKVKPEQADYLERIEGYEIVGRAPYARAEPEVVPSFYELGEQLAEEREHGKTRAAPESATGNALIDALIAGVGGPQALLALIAPQLASGAQVAAAQAQQTAAQQAAEAEEKRDWRYSDLAGRIDPEDALELLHDFADPGTDLGAMSDAALLSTLAKKANAHPGLDLRVRDLLEG